MFAHLQFMKQIGLENTTFTMVDMLVKGLGWATSTKYRDKKRVVEALNGLSTKGYITIEHDGKILKDSLVIKINKEMEKNVAETKVGWKENPFVWKGFTKVNYDRYNLAKNNGFHLMAIGYTLWRENAQHEWRIAIKEWEGIFGVTDKTAREILNGCTSFITKISGDHYQDKSGQVKQEANIYTMQTDFNSLSKSKETKQEFIKESLLDREYKKVTDIEVISSETIFKQIFDKNTFIKFEGYKVWKETECPNVKKAGQKKIDAMRASQNKVAGEVADRLEMEYQESLYNQKHNREWMKQQMDRHMDDEWISNYEEFVPSYVKKERPNDELFED
ncbi:hypothetical protein [Guptibacillus spartinae]|uniref:hypothetical protein n=1 Tax=Guptibacillus spartinae TaxID=3025679 RepID=UPI0023617A13|nr:hypothetical protein [Pseudalkalibacillus spartinae]